MFVSTRASFKDSHFVANKATSGGAIYSCDSSHLEVTNLTLKNNQASENGGGMALCKSSTLTFQNYQYFTDNQAATGKGGSAYIEDTPDDCRVNSCLLSWEKDAVIHQKNNTAVCGHLLYGGMIDRCQRTPESAPLKSFTISSNNTYSNSITSEEVALCFYESKETMMTTQCHEREIKITLYPGQTFHLKVVCLDQQIGQPIHCDVTGQYQEKTEIELDRR